MTISFPCKICEKAVAKNHRAVKCDNCDLWVHIKCNKINKQTYNLLMEDNTTWFCIDCTKSILPFNGIDNNELHCTLQGKKIKFSTFSKKVNPYADILIEQLNDMMDQEQEDFFNPSAYFDCKKFNENFDDKTYKGTNFLHMNINSLSYHFDDLHTLLSQLSVNFDIIGITETHLRTHSLSTTNINLHGYSIEHTPTESTKGGSLLYINNNINYICRNDLQIYKKKQLETTFIEIINPNGKNIIVGCIYRHPCMEVSEFNDYYLHELLTKLNKEKKQIVLMGDFNIDILKYDNNSDSSNFLDNMYTNSLIPYITAPSRITTRSKTLIDNIFSNIIEEDITSGNLTTTISDHFAQFYLTKKRTKQNSHKKVYKHNFKNFNKDAFERDLRNINWDEILETKDKNVNKSFENFLKKFNELLSLHAPIQRMTNKEIKLHAKPWITKGILTSINAKNRIYRKLCRTKNPIRKEELYNSFKIYRNMLNKITRHSKANHYRHFFEENKNKAIKIWNGIREIIQISKKSNQSIKNLNVNGKITSDPKLIANTFNQFFFQIPQKIEAEIVPTTKHFHDFLHNPSEASIFLSPTSENEVENQIKTLKNHKANGPSSIPNKLFKQFKSCLKTPVAILVNLTFEQGEFPEILKTAKIIPTHKRGSKTDCNNYRPISLISNLSKILEKIMYIRLYSFLEQKKFLYEHQFGFRNNRSTTHALIEITENIRKACDEGIFSCGVFLDLRKAFDTVNHEILLSKLEYYGIRGKAKNWFKSFINNRQQFTSIDGHESDPNKISHGVPQGSVLGPLLFIIFINDLHLSVKHSKVRHFADDTNLLLSDKSLKKINKHINHDLSLINKWLRANKISLNTSKTEIIIFRKKNKAITKHLDFRIGGQRIEVSNKVKYLGIILQEHLEWNIHINNLSNKLNRAIGLLSKIRHYVPKFLLRTIYYALFNSHLIYACQVWGQKETIVRKLLTIQNKALRIINFKPFDHPADPLYHSNKILKITDYIKLLNCMFVKDVLSGNCLSNFEGTFKLATNIHQHRTRHSTNNAVTLKHSQTQIYGIQSIEHQAATSWNALQNAINMDLLRESSHKSKDALMAHFINRYQH